MRCCSRDGRVHRRSRCGTPHRFDRYSLLAQRIKDVESILASRLEEQILEGGDWIDQTFQSLARLDCVLSFAECALELDYVRPNLVPMEEQCIDIRNGRHPLQEMLVGRFVQNDTNIDSDNRVNVLTGPNFSGKSCYARQVAVLVLMAHWGCFIPCAFARISVVSQILTRFGSKESCSVPQSSFQLDLSQMGMILRRADENSLVVRIGCDDLTLLRSLMSLEKERAPHPGLLCWPRRCAT